MKPFTDTVAFLLELCMLAAFVAWGIHTGSGTAAKIALAVAAPVVAALIWGAFLAPKAPVQLPAVGHFALACLVFAAASAALAVSGDAPLGIALIATFLANRLLVEASKQRV